MGPATEDVKRLCRQNGRDREGSALRRWPRYRGSTPFPLPGREWFDAGPSGDQSAVCTCGRLNEPDRTGPERPLPPGLPCRRGPAPRSPNPRCRRCSLSPTLDSSTGTPRSLPGLSNRGRLAHYQRRSEVRTGGERKGCGRWGLE